MAVVMCNRCDKLIDLDWFVDEVVTKDQVPSLDGTIFVCVDCLTDKEWQQLEENE